MFDEPYRPRRPTAAEKEKDREHQQYKRKRQQEKREREKETREKRTSKLTYSDHSGVGYQDFNLGPSGPVRTRVQFDRRAYLDYRSGNSSQDRPFLDSVPSLAECCLEIVAENYGEPAQLVALDSVRHRTHVKPLFDRVKGIRNDAEGLLPFEFWLDFALEFGLDLPNRYKTYKGLVVSSDQEELDVLKEHNEEAARLWIQQPSIVPSFFLATLDLSNDRTFTDSDVYKLRNPLSNFLAVLKLDNTSVTDTGIAWISRAASDSDAYKHLEVLSLRGLTRVTNDGVAKLSKLANLRMLDLRNTACNAQVITQLSNQNISPSWSTPRARKDLTQTLIEFQLFGGGFSPSRTLSILHHLAQVHHSPVQTLETTIRSPLLKQLSIHLSAMTRRPASSASKANHDRTSEELYNEQIALSTFSGSARATHHSAFGNLTSTKSLARKLVDEDGRAMGEKGAAFRNGLGDGVALGEWVGQGRVGGRSTLYDQGTKKVTARQREREPFSDTEDEEEKRTMLREEEAEELRIWEDKTSGGFSFYAGRKPIPKPDRVIVAAEQSKLTLLRYIPFVPPYERRRTTTAVQEQEEETDLVGKAIRVPAQKVQEGATLLKKKKRKLDQDTPLSSSSPRPSVSSTPETPRVRPLLPPSSARSASVSSTTSIRGQPSSTPSNPFSKKPKTAVAGRTDRKNIVKCAPTLAKRSSLSAFKR
ncbi:uncharacterized protein JCM6883_006450 [Sporobolomyces salmoneus]|uniref:uncharacterized protein n=1 Tax=Sporobolomyces salmoneus TaxID=183962 RepID=UPI003182A636